MLYWDVTVLKFGYFASISNISAVLVVFPLGNRVFQYYFQIFLNFIITAIPIS